MTKKFLQTLAKKEIDHSPKNEIPEIKLKKMVNLRRLLSDRPKKLGLSLV